MNSPSVAASHLTLPRRLQLLQHPWRLASLGQSQVVLEVENQQKYLQIADLLLDFRKKNDWDIVSWISDLCFMSDIDIFRYRYM